MTKMNDMLVIKGTQEPGAVSRSFADPENLFLQQPWSQNRFW